mmetsp:Transcript_27454/g.84255  ORF Transcript_27454/g.84255 Transcript_27454/m.84255 type:complete len:238 (-) Transcript_27454:13-726(-)
MSELRVELEAPLFSVGRPGLGASPALGGLVADAREHALLDAAQAALPLGLDARHFRFLRSPVLLRRRLALGVLQQRGHVLRRHVLPPRRPRPRLRFRRRFVFAAVFFAAVFFSAEVDEHVVRRAPALRELFVDQRLRPQLLLRRRRPVVDPVARRALRDAPVLPLVFGFLRCAAVPRHAFPLLAAGLRLQRQHRRRRHALDRLRLRRQQRALRAPPQRHLAVSVRDLPRRARRRRRG